MPRSLQVLLVASVSLLQACDKPRDSAPRPAATAPAPPAPMPAPAVSAAPRASSAPNEAVWRQLLALGRILANTDAPETCEDDEAPHVLVVDGAQEALLVQAALGAGCRALEGTSGDETSGPFPGRPVCCPRSLAGAPDVATGGAKSCARALIDHVTLAPDAGAPALPSVSLDRHGALLNTGTFLADCRVATTTAAVLCVAVDRGNVRGVSVALAPFDAQAADCVAGKVRGLPFPAGASMDVTITRFAPER